MFLCHAALFVLFSVLRTLSLSPSVSLFCCTLLSLSSYFYPSHSFQDVLFSLPPYLYFSCSLSTSSSSCCSFRLSCCCHCWYSASLRCTVPCVCVWGGEIKRIWDGGVGVRSRGRVKDKRIVEVKGKKGGEGGGCDIVAYTQLQSSVTWQKGWRHFFLVPLRASRQTFSQV